MSEILYVILLLFGAFVLLSIAANVVYYLRVQLGPDPIGSRRLGLATDWHAARLDRCKSASEKVDYLRAFMRRAQSTMDDSFARFIGNVGGDLLERHPDANYPDFEKDYEKSRDL